MGYVPSMCQGLPEGALPGSAGAPCVLWETEAEPVLACIPDDQRVKESRDACHLGGLASSARDDDVTSQALAFPVSPEREAKAIKLKTFAQLRKM